VTWHAIGRRRVTLSPHWSPPAMLRSTLVLAAALALTAAGCRTTAPPEATAPATAAPDTLTPPMPPPMTAEPPADGRVMRPGAGDPLSLQLAQADQRHGHSVRFLEVVEDSRCPMDVTCVWEGRAVVAVAIDGTRVELYVPYASQQDAEPSMIELGMIAVEVVGLDPYPGSPEAGAGAPVTLRLVTRHAGS